MKNKLIQLAKKENITIEIYEVHESSTTIDILNNKEKNFQVNNVKSYLIKALINGKCIKLNVESLNDPEKIIANIKSIANIQENDNKNILNKNDILNKTTKVEQLDFNKVKKDLLSLNELKKEYPFLNNIEIGFSNVFEGYYLTNENHEMVDELAYNYYEASISAKKGEINKVTYLSYYSKNYDFNEFKNQIINKINILKTKLESSSIKTGKYNIILKNNLAADILERFSSMFYLKNINMKESILTDKINKKIFNNQITIIEDSQNEKNIFKRTFDSEGTIRKKKTIVDKGVFKLEVNNLEYAIKCNVDPTGNAGGFNNLYIVKGNNSYDELVKNLEDGIIIDELYGLHSGIDIKSGIISLQAEGLLIKDGKIVKGLDTIIFSTDLFELFNNIIMIGNDYSCSNPGFNSPSLLIKNITIAGKE